MKKVIIPTIPLTVSFVWLALNHQGLNPFLLKGPEFIRFYLILAGGFFVSVLWMKINRKEIPKIMFYFATAIFIVGITKLLRGVILGKPIGYLTVILIIELIVILIIKVSYCNKKFK